MQFVDEVTIYVRGGKGGNGSTSFRRESHYPRGGPDGGDGGNGGYIMLVVDEGLNTLIDTAYQPHLFAKDGGDGEGNGCTGKSGDNVICKVPLGTQVFYQDRLVADLNKVGARWVAARGGVGGKGNRFFKSATRQSPDFAQEGQPGDECTLRLVLKSVADVGLVGLPNVGKSTLISKLTSATPKVANYPFTTLHPNLGVITIGERRVVIADIPGLIPGAAEGKGLGIKFLKHIERTRTILQLIDVTTPLGEEAPASDESTDEELRAVARAQFEAIDFELSQFSDHLASLPRLVAFTKADLPIARRAFEVTDLENTILISSHSEHGLTELIELIGQKVAKQTSSE